MTPSHPTPQISTLLGLFGIKSMDPFADEVRCLSCHNRIGLLRLLPLSTFLCEHCRRERVSALLALEEDDSVTRCGACLNRMHVDSDSAGDTICNRCRSGAGQ